MTTPTPKQTEDKMTWQTEDVEWVEDAPNPPKKKSAAQRLADRIRRGDGPDQQRR